MIYKNINDSFFEKIDTEEKAYFLGLFYADGCNYINGNASRVALSLQEDDKKILEIFNNFIYPNEDRPLL